MLKGRRSEAGELTRTRCVLRAAGKIMSEKVDALRLTFYTAPSSCAVLAPFFYAREARPLPFQRDRGYF